MHTIHISGAYQMYQLRIDIDSKLKIMLALLVKEQDWSELSETVDFSSATLSKHITALENEGIINTTISPIDRRKKIYHIDALKVAAFIDETLLPEKLTKEEIKEFAKYLKDEVKKRYQTTAKSRLQGYQHIIDISTVTHLLMELKVTGIVTQQCKEKKELVMEWGSSIEKNADYLFKIKTDPLSDLAHKRDTSDKMECFEDFIVMNLSDNLLKKFSMIKLPTHINALAELLIYNSMYPIYRAMTHKLADS